MYKTRILGKVSAMIASAYVALIVGAGMFIAVLLRRIARHASARGISVLDISKTHLLQEQESPKRSATRLNAIWMGERSQA